MIRCTGWKNKFTILCFRKIPHVGFMVIPLFGGIIFRLCGALALALGFVFYLLKARHFNKYFSWNFCLKLGLLHNSYLYTTVVSFSGNQIKNESCELFWTKPQILYNRTKVRHFKKFYVTNLFFLVMLHILMFTDCGSLGKVQKATPVTESVQL